MSVFIIAEAGVNHNGDPGRALAMVNVAREAGADAIKFQTFSAAKLVAKGAEKAEYQKRQTGGGGQFEMLQALEMSDDLHRALFQRCAEQGIEFMSTPFDTDALEFLVSLGMRRIKVPSGELTNHPFLRQVAVRNLPIFLSTGMASLNEITDAVRVIDDAQNAAGLTASTANQIIVLHCTSNYPAAAEELNLLALSTIKEACCRPVGYSDHSLGIAASPASVALGAQVIEKHFTLDRGLPGPDHAASLEPGELKEMIRQIRFVEAALGSPEKKPTESELKVRDVARRSIAAAVDLPTGHLLRTEDLIFLRPGTGIPPSRAEEFEGRVLSHGVGAGELIGWADLSD